MDFQETTIDLIRHGEPRGGPKLRGALDDPLSEEGWTQMIQAIGDFRAWQVLTSSPLSRCRDFAQWLSQDSGLDLDIAPDFREIGFGEWEGLTTKALLAQDPDALRRYWLNPDQHTPPGGEPLLAFSKRVHTAWESLVESMAGKHGLLVCHGGVIRAVLTRVLHMPPEKLWCFDVPYANVTRVIYRKFEDGHQTGQLCFHQRRLSFSSDNP